ncbi:MAG: DUF4421 family protein [Bacteroidia bacterium]|nr:DUF4421 family protein [Bacteroidia bacterium]
MRIIIKRYIILFISAIIFHSGSIAGITTDSLSVNKEKKKKKPEYVEDIKYEFSFHPYYLNQSTLLSFKDKITDGEKINYRPNMLGGITLAASYKFISLSYTLPIPQSDETRENFGKTDFNNVNLNIRTRSLALNFFFLKYRGYYQDSSDALYPKFKTDAPYPQRRDIQAITIGFSNHFIFSTSFSLKAAYEQNERQKKSRGAPMLYIADRFMFLKADNTVIPYANRSQYPDIYGLNKGTFNTFIVAPGFGYAFVLGDFSITPVVLLGTGLQYQAYKVYDYTEAKNRQKLAFKFTKFVNFKTAFGYNSDYFFTRLVYGIDMNNIPFKKTADTNLIFLTGEVCVGVRF